MNTVYNFAYDNMDNTNTEEKKTINFSDMGLMGKVGLIAIVIVCIVVMIYLFYNNNTLGIQSITYFSKDGCPYCQKFEPVWQKLKESSSLTGAKFQKKDNVAGKKAGITAYPTLVVKHKVNKRYGNVKTSSIKSFNIVGYHDYDDVMKQIKSKI